MVAKIIIGISIFTVLAFRVGQWIKDRIDDIRVDAWRDGYTQCYKDFTESEETYD